MFIHHIIMFFLWISKINTLLCHYSHVNKRNIYENRLRYNNLKNKDFRFRLYGQKHKQDQIYIYALDNKKLYISSKSMDNLNLDNLDDNTKDNNEWILSSNTIRTIESQYDKIFPQHENFLTYLYMSVIGFDNVRGGSYRSKESLTSLDIEEIHKKLNQHGIDCLLCNYYSKQSKNKTMVERTNNKMKESVAVDRHLTCNCSYHDCNVVNLNELVFTAASSLLNAQQYKAVTLPHKTKDPSIIIAGAGSGKTKVLAHRIAYLYLQLHGNKDFTSNSLLATTFTNKAAKELISRVELLIKEPKMKSIDFFKYDVQSSNPQWLGTFHSLAIRFLLSNSIKANWKKEYKILADEAERNVIIKDILKNANVTSTETELKQYTNTLKSFIDKHQNLGKRATQIELLDKSDEGYESHRRLVNFYNKYETSCRKNNYADFNELLLKTIELFESSPTILSKYQKQFQHILIDEFQDTNIAQYKLVKLLTNHTTEEPSKVGDDDQSIYAFRGSSSNIFQQVLQDYQIMDIIADNNFILSSDDQSDTIVNSQIHKLEQNYRSHGNIVSASNAVIKKNKIRISKQLWTSKDSGDPIQIIEALTDRHEAELIVKEIQNIVKKSSKTQSYQYKDITILYRTKQQSIQLEKSCINFKIPYKVIKSGITFFEREEIKHILAYLHLINNKMDNLAFERIVNVPKRNIGPASLQYLIDYADERKMSLWDASKDLIAKDNLADISLKPKAIQAISSFITLIEEIEKYILTLPKHEIIAYVIETIKLIEHYQTIEDKKNIINDISYTIKDRARIENIQEFIELSKKFDYEDEDFNRNPITKFLNEISLLSSDYEVNNSDNISPEEISSKNYIQLMTIHSSKGLEFPIVFIAGLEMNLFPKNNDEDEEERRLFYVAMTRAQRRLYITYAMSRNQYGDNKRNRPSKFLNEVPLEYYVFRPLR